ncbi:hypothetical protein, partial [Klebsiella pneumoniae]|uniref:hypothetical protein n=1 Tax=Klebsiella pneumoniae TaxID=573 RepID=UPI003F8198D4
TFLANNLLAFHQRASVDQRLPALTDGGVDYCLMEDEAAEMADGAHLSTLVGGHHHLRRVLHHKQVVLFCDCHDDVHLAGYAG